MLRHRTLLRLASAPAALLLAVSGSTVASAGEPGYRYTMHLSEGSATVHPGDTIRTFITFQASRRLYGDPVDLTAIGLPSGVTATFRPHTPRVGGRSTMILTTAPGSTVGTFTVTVSAIVDPSLSSDPIGTTSTFALTVD